ncbi:hypothetical protein SAMN04244548_02991 [Paracoccus pantotrophus]|nr:hypothetical protein SAMN04244548_02991 [Paracoccus pantotrophus]
MARPNDKFEALARDAAARIDASRDLQQQLSLLPDEAQGAGGETRRTRGAGKAMSQMRQWLAERGMRLPEEVLAEMAGLTSAENAFLATMAEAEQLLAWAQAGAKTGDDKPVIQTMAARLATFQQLYAIRLRAADALMPYGAPKATPDAAPVNVTQIIVPGPAALPAEPSRTADQARDVTPGPRRIGPPPMPHQIQQNQQVDQAATNAPAPARRTDGGTD